tara:strand:+ start:134 stop:1111 length:978 start_codon:yes stop_codon:yes gene_type:complete
MDPTGQFWTSWDDYTSDFSAGWNAIGDATWRQPRVMGGLQALGGAAQMVGGGALVGGGSVATGASLGTASPVSVPAVIGGGLLMGMGADNLSTGLQQMWTGVPQETLLHSGVRDLAEMSGASPETANTIANYTEAGANVLSSGPAFLAKPQIITSQKPLYSYTYSSKFEGDVFRVTTAGRAWATTHKPGPWAFETGIKNTLQRWARTGQRKPFNSHIEFTGNALNQFKPVDAIGLFRGWKRSVGQHFTHSPGHLNTRTGQILNPSMGQRARFWSDQIGSHAFDAGAPLVLGGIGLGLYGAIADAESISFNGSGLMGATKGVRKGQ